MTRMITYSTTEGNKTHRGVSKVNTYLIVVQDDRESRMETRFNEIMAVIFSRIVARH